MRTLIKTKRRLFAIIKVEIMKMQLKIIKSLQIMFLERWAVVTKS